MHKLSAVIIGAAAILLVGVFSFFIGLNMGRGAAGKQSALDLEKIKQNISQLPGLTLAEPADNVIVGRVRAKQNGLLTVGAIPQTIEQALSDAAQEYKIQITEHTKIFFQAVNDNPDLTKLDQAAPDLVVERLVSAEDIKINEQVCVSIDPLELNNPAIKALAIKLSR